MATMLIPFVSAKGPYVRQLFECMLPLVTQPLRQDILSPTLEGTS